MVDRVEPRGFEEAVDRGLGRIDPRAFLLLAHIGRAGRQAVDDRGEPARRGEGLQLFILEPGPGQRLAPAAGARSSRARLASAPGSLGE